MTNIRRFLDLSTGHLRPSTREWLDLVLGHSLSGSAVPYGFWVYASEDPPEDDEYPEELEQCRQRARSMACEYMLFDADGPIDPALTWFGDAETADPCITPSAPAPAPVDNISRLLAEAVNSWPQLDTDEEINGGDMVEWFSTWRDAAMRAIKAERPDLFAAEPWGDEDAECAAAEGWFLDQSDFMSLIQALDDCDVFTGPTANLIAYQHVERRAREGSWLHAKALRIHGTGAEPAKAEDVAA